MNLKRRLKSPLLAYVLLAGSFAGAYVWYAAVNGFVGFPLDDAWIYQTYARNLGQRLELAFIPGQPSAGSTSPLWTALLAVGYGLRLDYRVWTFGLGTLLLAINGWLAHLLVARLWPGRQAAAWAVGFLVVGEWHLIWSAASGMETLAFSATALLVFLIAADRAEWLGVAAGLALLTRPDGLSLLPFALLRAALPDSATARNAGTQTGSAGSRAARWLGQVRWRGVVRASITFALFAFGYLVLNQLVGGTPWPNTFYAKQAEYASLRSLPIFSRLIQVGSLPFIGPAALALPGLGLVLALVIRSPRRWVTAAPVVWAAGLILAYALRLPVTYQHGRYLVPAVPILLACGAGGWITTMAGADRGALTRVISRTWTVSMFAVAAGFLVLGAQAYLRDVRIIETEMVQTARWLAVNTETGALLAVHDIGAVGYFSGRELLDLAGLVSPEVIPFIRDEPRLAQWLTERGARYLVTFPHWYQGLASPPAAVEIYATGSPFSPAVGGENMSVYRWNGVQP